MKSIRITKQVTPRESASLEKYLREIARFKLLNPEDEAVVTQRVSMGDKNAMETLIKANLRFVVSVAKQYQNQGLELMDLINEGNIGLIKAAELFDDTRGFKFITYAVWWIRQAILQALDETSRIVRLPNNKVVTIKKVNDTFVHLEQVYQREPTDAEIAELLKLEPEIVKEAHILDQGSVSMDIPLSDEDSSESTFYEIVDLGQLSEPDRILVENSVRNDVKRALSSLRQREAEIVRLVFGIDREIQSIEEIGKKLDVSHERIRQIKEKALKKLKGKYRSKLLKQCLEK